MSDEEKSFITSTTGFFTFGINRTREQVILFSEMKLHFAFLQQLKKKIKLKIILDLSNFLGKNETGRYARQFKRIIIKRVSWFKSSLLLRIKTVDITNINS